MTDYQPNAVIHPPGTVELISQYTTDDQPFEPDPDALLLCPTPSDDPNDPLRWSTLRKSWNYGLLIAMTISVFSVLSIQPVFWSQMLEEMHVTQEDLNNAQAAQLVGLAVGCIIFIPIAKKYGRRPVYIISTLIVAGATWWSAFMDSARDVILTNVLAGLAGATNETAVQMSIRDLYFVHQRGSANGIYLVAVTAGAFLTPMAAGAQALYSGWRSSYITLACFMTGLTILFAISFEETKFVPPPERGPDIEISDDASIRKGYPIDVKSMTAAESEDPTRARRTHFRLQLITKTDESIWKTIYYPIFTSWYPHVVFTYLEFASGIAWVVMVSAITSIVFSKAPYDFNPLQVGFMFGGTLIGSVFGSLYGGMLVDWAIVKFAKRNRGLFEPEMRLWLMPLPAIAMSLGLAVFGITADRGMHWVFPSIGGGVFAFGFGAISDITFTLVIDSFPNLVAQTFVIIAFFRNALSIVGPFSITPWMEAMSISAIFVVAGSISLSIHVFAVPLAIWGKRTRASIAPQYYRLTEKLYPEMVA
ncbi:hypothetical protein CDD83_10917 [Cordyceps sp. RAO-2017]|nr:hypothetical protein CDD83_10917 [Cordyceps sp. RAO-2017]